MLDIVDVKAVCDLAHKAGAKVVLDNAFATPILQRPLEWGADIVIHSATKYIDGQGRTLGGAVLGSKEFILDKLQPIIRNTGPSLSPFNAWVLVKGMETLGLRIERHCANAARVADALAAHPAIGRVLYPGRKDHPQHALAMKQMSGAGGVVTFDLKAGKWAAFETLNRAEADRHLQQPRRRKEPGDASGDHHAHAHRRRGARQARHRRRHRAHLGRPRGRRGHHRRPGAGAGLSGAVSLALHLWDINADWAARIRTHDFVQGLGNGSLPIENFKRYVAQDAYFLDAFARGYAFCLANGTSREDLYGFPS